MGIQDIIAIAIALAALAYVIRILVRSFTGRGGCTACDTTQSSADGSSSSSRIGLKRKPMVTVDQIGTPASEKDAPEKS